MQTTKAIEQRAAKRAREQQRDWAIFDVDSESEFGRDVIARPLDWADSDEAAAFDARILSVFPARGN